MEVGQIQNKRAKVFRRPVCLLLPRFGIPATVDDSQATTRRPSSSFYSLSPLFLHTLNRRVSFLSSPLTIGLTSGSGRNPPLSFISPMTSRVLNKAPATADCTMGSESRTASFPKSPVAAQRMHLTWGCIRYFELIQTICPAELRFVGFAPQPNSPAETDTRDVSFAGLSVFQEDD